MSSFLSAGCIYKEESYRNVIKKYIDLISEVESIEIDNLVCYNLENDISIDMDLEELEKGGNFSEVTHINCSHLGSNWSFTVRLYEEDGYQGVLFDMSYDYIPEDFSFQSLEGNIISVLMAIHSCYPYYFSFVDTEAEVDMFDEPTNIDPLESPYAAIVIPNNNDFHIYLNSWEIDGMTGRDKKDCVKRKTSFSINELLNNMFTDNII
ncbi:Imm64 family immunity protein [Paenilisteria rocourtiae]|uniref:Immunity protein 64 of polymorphic toxin system n=1 Tax=Listeria rocourtiae TaxID=647910 RepID=A0A4V3DNZ5_9LIST|nr:Imm64 family immunity protein [Listeria rocourtiae]EUJ42282.1 hypothetical protein PROCOU_17505 [Listeria rocourtiae FSL F6-920]TDR50316.1 immunity protein 64 of polymorphic toxin system [Listeria rocourtiae]